MFLLNELYSLFSVIRRRENCFHFFFCGLDLEKICNGINTIRKESSAFDLFIRKMRRSLSQEGKQNDDIQNLAEGKIQFEMIKCVAKVFFCV